MKVVVVGGGVIGLWCARALLREGAEVVVIDRGDRAMATPAAAGWVVRHCRLLSPGLACSGRPCTRSCVARPRSDSVRRCPRPCSVGCPALSPAPRGTATGRHTRHPRAGRSRESRLPRTAPRPGALRDARSRAAARGRTEGGMCEALVCSTTPGRRVRGRYRVSIRRGPIPGAGTGREVLGAVHAESEVGVRPEDLLTALSKSVIVLGGAIVGGAPVDAIIPALGGRWSTGPVTTCCPPTASCAPPRADGSLPAASACVFGCDRPRATAPRRRAADLAQPCAEAGGAQHRPCPVRRRRVSPVVSNSAGGTPRPPAPHARGAGPDRALPRLVASSAVSAAYAGSRRPRRTARR